MVLANDAASEDLITIRGIESHVGLPDSFLSHFVEDVREGHPWQLQIDQERQVEDFLVDDFARFAIEKLIDLK